MATSSESRLDNLLICANGAANMHGLTGRQHRAHHLPHEGARWERARTAEMHGQG